MSAAYASPPPCVDQHGHKFTVVPHEPKSTVCERCGVKRVVRENGSVRYV